MSTQQVHQVHVLKSATPLFKIKDTASRKVRMAIETKAVLLAEQAVPCVWRRVHGHGSERRTLVFVPLVCADAHGFALWTRWG